MVTTQKERKRKLLDNSQQQEEGAIHPITVIGYHIEARVIKINCSDSTAFTLFGDYATIFNPADTTIQVLVIRPETDFTAALNYVTSMAAMTAEQYAYMNGRPTMREMNRPAEEGTQLLAAIAHNIKKGSERLADAGRHYTTEASVINAEVDVKALVTAIRELPGRFVSSVLSCVVFIGTVYLIWNFADHLIKLWGKG